MEETKKGKSAKYPGVYWRQVRRLDGLGEERMYYIIYRRGGRGGKKIEEKLGRASEDWTEAKANIERAARISGKLSNRERRLKEAENASTQVARPTLDNLWEIYRNDHSKNASITSHTYLYNGHIRQYIGGKIAETIETSDINRIRRELERQQLSPKSVKDGLSLIRTILRFAHKQGKFVMPQNLVFDMPKVDNETTETMTEEELKAYHKALDEEPDQNSAAFLRMILFTGMRRGALMSLRWDDIDFEKKIIKLRGESAKNGKTAYIPLNNQAEGVLKAITPSGEYVFPGKDGGQRKSFRRMAQRVRDKAGLPASFRPLHGLRHTYASYLASSGKVDMYTLQKLLTHSSPQMTQRYAHLHDEALKRGADIAGSIFGDKSQE